MNDSSKMKVKSLVFGLLIAAAVFEGFNFIGGQDYIKSWSYKPTGDMQKIIDSLDLTDRGNLVLRATKPSLDNRDVFNNKCDSHDSNIYILGCYLTADDNIHLYNIDSEELDGIKESTTAHELLHALWSRMPFWEQSKLKEELKAVYDGLSEDNDIKESMKLYSDDDFYDELHSRLGTEIESLPENLEKHYESVFKNQDQVVSYYKKYSGKFKKMEQELKNLEVKIQAQKTYIDEETARLDTESTNLNKRIEDYNKRVQSGNYTSLEAAQKEGNELSKQVDLLNKSYDSLNNFISEYNKMIDEYNNNVVQTNELMETMNSNSNKVEGINE